MLEGLFHPSLDKMRFIIVTILSVLTGLGLASVQDACARACELFGSRIVDTVPLNRTVANDNW
jgi:hypothetical protein